VKGRGKGRVRQEKGQGEGKVYQTKSPKTNSYLSLKYKKASDQSDAFFCLGDLSPFYQVTPALRYTRKILFSQRRPSVFALLQRNYADFEENA
jgi:hypothetical protein